MYRKNLVFAAACLGDAACSASCFCRSARSTTCWPSGSSSMIAAIGTLTALLPFGILVGSLDLRAGGRSIWLPLDARRRIADRGRSLRRHGVCRTARAWCSCSFCDRFRRRRCSTARPMRWRPMSAKVSAARSSVCSACSSASAHSRCRARSRSLSHSYSDRARSSPRSARWCWCRPRIAWRSRFRRRSCELERFSSLADSCAVARSVLALRLPRTGHPKRHGRDVERLDDSLFQECDAWRRRAK